MVARIRTIKPEFFGSEDVSGLSFRARLTWIGLWVHCDDHGRMKDVDRLVKAHVWPLEDEVGLDDIESDLEELAENGRIIRYEVDGRRFLAVTNWHSHQRINRPTKSRIPAPDTPTDMDCEECSRSMHGGLTEASVSAHGGLTVGDAEVLTEGSLWEGKGKEGKGGTPSGGPLPDRPSTGTTDRAHAQEGAHGLTTHPFKDNGHGSCKDCPLPRKNSTHGGAE